MPAASQAMFGASMQPAMAPMGGGGMVPTQAHMRALLQQQQQQHGRAAVPGYPPLLGGGGWKPHTAAAGGALAPGNAAAVPDFAAFQAVRDLEVAMTAVVARLTGGVLCVPQIQSMAANNMAQWGPYAGIPAGGTPGPAGVDLNTTKRDGGDLSSGRPSKSRRYS